MAPTGYPTGDDLDDQSARIERFLDADEGTRDHSLVVAEQEAGQRDDQPNGEER